MNIHMTMHQPKIKNKESFSLNVQPNAFTKKFECDKCGKVLTDLDQLKEHKLTNRKIFPATPKPLTKKPDIVEKCDTCIVNFTKENNTERASEVVTQHMSECKETYQCEKCVKQSKSQSGLFEHIEINHGQTHSPEPKKVKSRYRSYNLGEDGITFSFRQ